MKKLLLIILMSSFLFSCEDNTYVESVEDVKAQKIEQIGALFKGIRRQPEVADELIDIASKGLYDSYEELLPLSDEAVESRGKARGLAIGELIESIAFNPDLFDLLESTAVKFLGVYDKEYISDELNEYAIANSYKYIFDAYARQPSLKAKFEEITLKFLGRKL
ncbi:MAG: hypothetical protein N4A49_07395 [Marinifilaceae bacterium]|jgi:F0F1-type ATP synthase membrane subunit c/vacuolar-type H+-ATPase subunit K|nr:hypothetical protein [Marinifilaceae bacterium]